MPKPLADANTSPLSVMCRLRVIAADLEARRPITERDRAWFCERFKYYEMEAPISGVTLDKAFGLAAPIGKSTWWSQEQLVRRDEAIRTIADRFLSDLGIADQAREIEREARLVARGRPSRLPVEGRALIQKALTVQRLFPAKNQMKNILKNRPQI